MTAEELRLRRTQVLYDEKWKKFLRRSAPWRFIPFVEFVLAAGSMATGEVHPDSDFDVIVGVRRGRIFTARFFSVLVFGLLGWRRKKLTHHEAARDKICLNHFVTAASYALQPPHNAYWKELYMNLVPLFGTVQAVNEFWGANAAWMGERREYRDDLRHRDRAPSRVKRAAERLLNGAAGDWLEGRLRRLQLAFIEKSLVLHREGYKPRIRYGDDELEFHPDTRRIELFLSGKKE